MRYVLTCDCGSDDFSYETGKFICDNCDEVYTEEQAGRELVAEIDIPDINPDENPEEISDNSTNTDTLTYYEFTAVIGALDSYIANDKALGLSSKLLKEINAKLRMLLENTDKCVIITTDM